MVARISWAVTRNLNLDARLKALTRSELSPQLRPQGHDPAIIFTHKVVLMWADFGPFEASGKLDSLVNDWPLSARTFTHPGLRGRVLEPPEV